MEWTLVLTVALGGAIGSILRYAAVRTLPLPPSASHWAVLIVNLLGCLAIGLLLGWMARRELDDRWRTFLTAGVLGGFTTFSTFAADALRLAQDRRFTEAALYITLSVVLGLALCAAGFWLTSQTQRR